MAGRRRDAGRLRAVARRDGPRACAGRRVPQARRAGSAVGAGRASPGRRRSGTPPPSVVASRAASRSAISSPPPSETTARELPATARATSRRRVSRSYRAAAGLAAMRSWSFWSRIASTIASCSTVVRRASASWAMRLARSEIRRWSRAKFCSSSMSWTAASRRASTDAMSASGSATRVNAAARASIAVRRELRVDPLAQQGRLGAAEVEHGQGLDAPDQRAHRVLRGRVDDLVEVAGRDRVGHPRRVG